MGLFRRKLLDAEAKLKEGKVDEGLAIMINHRDFDCAHPQNGRLFRLKQLFETYTSTMIRATKPKIGVQEEAYKRMLLESIETCKKTLDQIKHEIRELIKEEVRLE